MLEMNIKDALVKTLHTPYDFHQIMNHYQVKPPCPYYDEFKDRLVDLVQSLRDIPYIFDHLSAEQKDDFFERIKNKPNLIKTVTDFTEAKVLSSQQCDYIFKLLQTNSDGKIESSLNYTEQYQSSINNINSLILPDILVNLSKPLIALDVIYKLTFGVYEESGVADWYDRERFFDGVRAFSPAQRAYLYAQNQHLYYLNSSQDINRLLEQTPQVDRSVMYDLVKRQLLLLLASSDDPCYEDLKEKIPVEELATFQEIPALHGLLIKLTRLQPGAPSVEFTSSLLDENPEKTKEKFAALVKGMELRPSAMITFFAKSQHSFPKNLISILLTASPFWLNKLNAALELNLSPAKRLNKERLREALGQHILMLQSGNSFTDTLNSGGMGR